MKHFFGGMLCLFLWANERLCAQSVGVGAQLGTPTALTVRINNRQGANLDFLGAWNFKKYYFINVHGLWERRVFDIPQFHYFYGPGIFLGNRSTGHSSTDGLVLGISGNFGLNLYLGRIELFGQLTPRFSVFPSTDGAWGGGVGGRYYLKG